MALTRKFLSALGIDADKVDEIISAHSDTVDALKAERDGFKADAEAYKEAKGQIEKLEKQVKEYEDSQGNEDSYKVKYEAIKDEYDSYKKSVQADAEKQTKTTVLKDLLKEIGISEKRIDAVVKVSDVDSIELDKDGNIKKVDDLKEKLKDEWADFIVTETKQGADVKKPPKNEGNGKMTKEDILKIADTTERQKAMIENHELFGI